LPETAAFDIFFLPVNSHLRLSAMHLSIAKRLARGCLVRALIHRGSSPCVRLFFATRDE
jgi:hypothetical protein